VLTFIVSDSVRSRYTVILFTLSIHTATRIDLLLFNMEQHQTVYHASLFSGGGGFDLAAEWMGWTNVFHCEKNPFGQSILRHYWPDAQLYEDIITADFTIWRDRVDILTGGFPCQPYSHAGKRLGKEDERHLWPQMLRAIREIRPTVVVGENVYGLVNWSDGLVFEEVCADLEAEGYEVQPVVLPAAAVGAPHRRDRVWFVAYSDSSRQSVESFYDQQIQRKLGNVTHAHNHGSHATEDRESMGSGDDGDQTRQNQTEQSHGRTVPSTASPTDTPSQPSQQYQPCQQEQGQPRGGNRQSPSTNSSSDRLEGLRIRGVLGEKKLTGTQRFSTAQDATNTHRSGSSRSRGAQGFSDSEQEKEWQKYRVVDDGRWPTQPPVCRRDDGFPEGLDTITVQGRKGTRTLSDKQAAILWKKESLMMYGNAVVPQVVYQIFQSIALFIHSLGISMPSQKSPPQAGPS